MKMYSGQVEYNLKRIKRSSQDEELFDAVKRSDFLKVRGLFKNFSARPNANAKDQDGNTPLHYASQYGSQIIVEFLLMGKIDLGFYSIRFKVAEVDAKGKDDKTPLHLAAKEGHEGVVKILLENKANIDATDTNDCTPLHEAVSMNKLDVVKLLVKEHADIKARNKDGETPLDLACERDYTDMAQFLQERDHLNKDLLVAVRQGNLDKVKGLVDGQHINVNYQDTDSDQRPIHVAAANGYLNIVRYFVDEKQANIEVKDKSGQTPLHYAASNGHLDVVRYFIDEKHANFNVRNNDNNTALHLATKGGHKGVVEFLLSKEANIEAKDKDNKTPLHLAVEGGHKGVVEFLLSKGANIEAQDKDGWTPLHYATWKGYKAVVEFLVNEKKANINAQSTSDGKKPVHAAAKAGYKEIVEFFLGKGIGVDDTDNDKWTPLHYAASYNHLELAQFLLDRGANVKAKNNDNKTPLDLADEYNYTEVIKLLVRKSAELDEVTPLHWAVKHRSLKIVNLFIEDDVNAKEEKHGWTPLHFAAQENKKDIAELLIRKNATVNAKNYRGWTPLHEAASKNSFNVTQLLVEKGADVNARNNKGWTPLHEAAKKGNSNIVGFLIKTNVADIEARSRNREDTPLHVAAGEGKLEVVVQLLVNNTANVNAINKYGKKPFDIAQDKGYTNVTDFLTLKTSRKRRDVSNEQEFSAASGSARSTSWINDYIAWIKDSASEFIGNIPFKRASSLLTNSTQVDYGTSSIHYGSEDNTGTTISQIDFNGTIALLDLFVRRFTGEKYPSFQNASLSQLEVLGYALNITQAFEKAIEHAAKESSISMHRLNINFVEVQGEIIKKVAGCRFDEITGVLNSHIREACSNIKSGKFSPKKFDRFITAFNNELPQISYEKERSISLSRANYIENQSLSLKDKNPSNYLEGVSVQGNLTQVKGV